GSKLSRVPWLHSFAGRRRTKVLRRDSGRHARHSQVTRRSIGESLTARSLSRVKRSPFAHVPRAPESACVDSLNNDLSVAVLTENARFCRRDWRRKTIRITCARPLADGRSGALERLEMAAEKPRYDAVPARRTSRS